MLRIGRMFYWQLARGQKGKQKGLSSTAITPPSTSIFTNQYARTGFIVFRIRLRCCCLFAGFARRNISNHWRRHNGVFDRGCGLCSVQSTGFCERIGHQMRGKYATFGWFRTQGWCTYRNVGRLRTQGWCTHSNLSAYSCTKYSNMLIKTTPFWNVLALPLKWAIFF